MLSEMVIYIAISLLDWRKRLDSYHSLSSAEAVDWSQFYRIRLWNIWKISWKKFAIILKMATNKGGLFRNSRKNDLSKHQKSTGKRGTFWEESWSFSHRNFNFQFWSNYSSKMSTSCSSSKFETVERMLRSCVVKAVKFSSLSHHLLFLLEDSK